MAGSVPNFDKMFQVNYPDRPMLVPQPFSFEEREKNKPSKKNSSNEVRVLFICLFVCLLTYSLINPFIISSFICSFIDSFIHSLPTRASEQGNVIGLVSVYIYIYINVIKKKL